MSKKWGKKKIVPAAKAKATAINRIVPQRDTPRPFSFSSAFTVRAADDVRKLPSFDGNAYTGAVMKPHGWWGDIIVDLEGIEVPSQQRPCLRQHDHEQPVGHTTSVTINAEGVHIAGVFSGQTEFVDKVVVPAKNGFPWQLSIGADPIKTEYLEAGEEETVNGITVSGPCTISRRTRLGEISFVPLGADGDTSVDIAAKKGPTMTSNWQLVLKEFCADLRATGKKCHTDAEIDNMSADEARAALKRYMKKARADDDDDKKKDPDQDDEEEDEDEDSDARAQDEDEDEDEAKAKAKASRGTALQSAARKAAMRAMKDIRKQAAAEHIRQAAIAAASRKHDVTEVEVDGRKVNLIAHAIENDWPAERAELYALRSARPSHGVGVPGGLGYSIGIPEINEAVLECAVFDALGSQFRLFDSDFYRMNEDGKRRVSEREEKRIMAELNGRYTDQVRQAAHTTFRGRIGLQQLLTTLAAAKGYRGPATFNDPGGWGEVATYLAMPNIRADSGASSVNTPATLANVQNKFMLQGYMFTEQVFNEVCAFLPVKDLKPTKSVQLFGDFMFAGLNPGGEIQHGTIGDNPYANQAKLVARMITLELQYIINDDLGMFGQVPMMLGRGWGLKVNDLVWTAFLNPGTDDGGTTNFYAATHTIPIGNQSANSNLSSGAGSTLSSAGLQAAKLLFDNQVDPAGKPLGVDAELLVYPPDLDVAAIELMNAQFIVMSGITQTAAVKQANTNIWKGRFKPLMSRYLNKTVYTGNSTTAWYIMANPAIIPVIQIAALNGQMTPMIQTASQDWQFNMLGISMRGWGGVGAQAQNFRGAVKSAGV